MKIGIGITTYNRPDHLRFCVEQVSKHLPPIATNIPVLHSEEYLEYISHRRTDGNEYTIVVVDGVDSISRAKNMCLYNLRDCDHIFLLDDDVFVKSGWVEFFTLSGLNHSLYMNERYRPYTITMDIPSKTFYRDSSGCFMYLTKEVIEKVGYFNTEFKGYGMEHSAFSYRIYRAGLTPAPYICLDRTSDYIHSLDLDGPFPGFDTEHKPSLSYAEMTQHIDHNRKVFVWECTDSPIYQAFEP